MQHLQKTGEGAPVMVNQPDVTDFAASASLLQPASPTGEITGRKARLDSRRAPSGPIVRQTRIHSRRRLRSRRRFGQTPSQQRLHPRQNPPTTDYPMRIVVLSEHRESKDLSFPPSPPRPRPPHLPRLRLLPPHLAGCTAAISPSRMPIFVLPTVPCPWPLVPGGGTSWGTCLHRK